MRLKYLSALAVVACLPLIGAGHTLPLLTPSVQVQDADGLIKYANQLAEIGELDKAIGLLEGQRAHAGSSDKSSLLDDSIVKLKKQARSAADIRGAQIAERGRALAARGAWAEAKAAYDEALQVANQSTAAIETLKKGRWEVEDQEARSKGLVPSFVASVSEPLLEVVKWLVVGLAGFVAAWLICQLRHLRKSDGVAIWVEDLGQSGNDRVVRNRATTRAVLAELERISGRGRTPARLDDVDTSGGIPLVKLVPQVSSIGDVSTLVHEDAVKVGPLSLNPRQLYSLLREWWYRPRRRLQAWLYVEGEETVITLEDSGSQPVGERGKDPLGEVVTGSGVDARREAILALAAVISYHLSKHKVCANAASYVALIRAERQLSGGKPNLAAARHSLEEALTSDPLNVFARIRLGSVLREMNQWAAAVGHFGVAESVLPGLGGVEAAFPELYPVVRYNLAAALMQADGDWKSHKTAVRVLEELLDSVPDVSEPFSTSTRTHITVDTGGVPWTSRGQLCAAWQDRLRLLCRSSLAAALVFEIREAGPRDDQPLDAEQIRRLGAHQDAFFNRIRGLVNEVQRLQLSSPSLKSAKLAAEAVAMAAAGEAAYLIGDGEAEYWLREAVSRQARAAEPSIGLARLLVERRLSGSADAVECKELLDSVLELRPGDVRASVLRGLMYLCPAFADEERALKDFERAPEDPAALWSRATILRRRAEWKRQALTVMARAIDCKPGIGYRQITYCTLLLSLPESEELNEEMAVATVFANQLTRSTRARFKRKGEEFQGRIALRRGYESRQDHIARHRKALEDLVKDVPPADGDASSPASLALTALKNARRELALLSIAERDEWNGSIKSVEESIRVLRRAIAIHKVSA